MSEDCNVCVYGGDGDLPEFSTERVVVGRKDHRCIECRETIAKGQRHEVVTGKWDGDVRSERTCLPCVEIRRAFFCDGWTYSLMWEQIEEDLFPFFNEACLAKLETAAAKARLSDRWRDWKFRP